MQQPVVCGPAVQCLREGGEMKDPKTAAQKALERTTAFEDSLEICRALLNAPYSSDYWAGEAECHIRGLWDHTKTLHKLLKAALEQPEQEPVAWMYVNSDGECEQIEYGVCDFDDRSITLLYTHPPRREWQGLTEDETMHLMNETYGNHWADEAHLQRFRRAVEAALKEKNK